MDKVSYQDVTIETIDQAVADWFTEVVAPRVRTPSDEEQTVPVLFASGERWATNKDKRGIRDKNGLLILPLISLRRTNIDRSRDAAIALGTETKTLTIAKRIDQKTNTIQNAIAARNPARRSAEDKAVFEVTTIPFPDWFTTGYEIVIQTQYTTQMNAIIEQIFHSLDMQNSFVMPVLQSEFDSDSDDTEWEDRKVLPDFYFVGFMDTDMSDTGNFEEFTDTERIVRYSYNITVPSYLQLDPDGKRPAVQRKFTSYEFGFSDECINFTDDFDELDDIFSFKKPT